MVRCDMRPLDFFWIFGLVVGQKRGAERTAKTPRTREELFPVVFPVPLFSRKNQGTTVGPSAKESAIIENRVSRVSKSTDRKVVSTNRYPFVTHRRSLLFVSCHHKIMSESPVRREGLAPPLVESPESTLSRGREGHNEDDPLLELEEDEGEWLSLFLSSFGNWIQSIPRTSQDFRARARMTVEKIVQSETERRRYLAGGLVLTYMLMMYLCSWTVTPNNGICPSYDESLTISVAWRLSRSPPPPDTCFTNQEIDEMLQEQEKMDGIFVRLTRPVTFLPRKRQRRGPDGDKDAVHNETGTHVNQAKMGTGTRGAGDGTVSSTNNGGNARKVSLRQDRRTYNSFVAVWRFIIRRFVHPRRAADEALAGQIENHPFRYAFSQEPLLSIEEMDFLEAWSDRLTDESRDWHRRVARVAWGGRSKWWHPVFSRSSYYPLETIDGANLLYPYYQVMQPSMRDMNHVRFPRRQCSSGCDTQVAILSTLEWRESYSPWMVTRDVLDENKDGWVYAHGLSKSGPYGCHGIVWLRIGQHPVKDSQAYARAIIHSVERAIDNALRQGRAGRVNVVVDAEGYEWGKLPNFHDIKEILAILQDHYPGRFGAAFVFNMSSSAEFLFSLLKPVLDKDILKKIYLLPSDTEERNRQLKTVIPSESMPSWLGGSDPFEFCTRKYYPRRIIMDLENRE